MTQKALFFFTDGFTGDVNDGAAPYTEEEFRDYNRAVLAGNEADAGVLAGINNELEVSGSSSPLTVDTGRAQVYGFHYFNDAAVAPTVTTPAVGDTGGRVVIRCNLTAANNPPLESQARVLVILNTDGNAAIPAMTQVANTTWDIPLATFVIDTSGDIWTDSSKSVAGVTDARIFAVGATAGLRMNWRQGGSSTVWATDGATDYPVSSPKVKIFAGSQTTGILGNVTITFPEAFSFLPLVIATAVGSAGSIINVDTAISTTQCTINSIDIDGAPIGSVQFNWIAMGV